MIGHIQVTVLFLVLSGSSSTLGKAGPPPKNSPEVNGTGIPVFPTKTERNKKYVLKY